MKRSWIGLMIIMIMIFPLSAWAEETNYSSSVDSLLPEKPPIETDKPPIYERGVSNYAIDFEDSLSSSALQTWNLFLTMLFGVVVVGWKLIIYFIQWAFTEQLFHSMDATIGKWTLNLRDNLFVGNILSFGIVVLCIVLVFSIGRSREVYENSRRFLILVVVSSILLSFMTPILNMLNKSEIFLSDSLFWGYARMSEEGTGSIEETRNQTLVKMGEKVFETFVHAPWMMAEFGLYPVPPYNEREKEVLKDSETVLKLNPLNPKDFIKREELVAEWTDSSVWSQWFNQLVPKPAGAIIEGVDKVTGNQVKYPSMTVGNTPWRTITVLGALILGGIYGLFLFLLAASALVCKMLVLILAAVLPILLLTIFIPRWGESVLIRWSQLFILSGMYKVIVSVFLIVILFLSELIYDVGKESIGLIYFAHVCFVIAVFVFHKMLWHILALPGQLVAGEIENIIKGNGSRVLDSVAGGVTTGTSMAGRVATAVVTRNPAALVSGGAAALALAKGGKKLFDGVKKEKNDFIPDGFTTASPKDTEFKKSEMGNPYKEGTEEAKMFDDIMKKGLNPYSPRDQRVYQRLLNKNPAKMQAFKTIQEHGKIFEKRKFERSQQQKAQQLMNQIDELEREEEKRRATERKQAMRTKMKSFLSRGEGE